MLLLETTSVSRKTPGDGKLEITKQTAERLRSAGAALTVTLGDIESTGAVVSMPCTCAKAAGTAHEHQFLQSELLRSLSPDLTVEIALDPAPTPARVYLRPV